MIHSANALRSGSSYLTSIVRPARRSAKPPVSLDSLSAVRSIQIAVRSLRVSPSFFDLPYVERANLVSASALKCAGPVSYPLPKA